MNKQATRQLKKEYDKEYRIKNKLKIQAYQIKNREKIKKQRNKFLLKNPEIRKKLLEYKKKHYCDNLQYYTDKSRKYKQQNKEIRNKKLSIRLKNDSEYKLKCNLRVRIFSALKGKDKSASTMKLIGCSINELWNHLESKFESWMTKENYGLWHVDHIIACAKFDLTCPEQQRICFNYKNLQPLSATDNLRKGDR